MVSGAVDQEEKDHSTFVCVQFHCEWIDYKLLRVADYTTVLLQ